MFIQSVRPWLAFMAGVDLRRDAPRNLDLKHIDDHGVFQPVTSNNLTMSFVEPFVSLDGTASRYLHFNLGVRQEEVWMDNQDLLNPQNSFNKLATLTLPKARMTLLPPDRWYLPHRVVQLRRSVSHQRSAHRQRAPASQRCWRRRARINWCFPR